MPQSMMGSVSGLSIASRTSRMSHARSVASVATLTSTMEKKTGLRFPILEYAGFTDVQRGSVLSALYTSVSKVFFFTNSYLSHSTSNIYFNLISHFQIEIFSIIHCKISEYNYMLISLNFISFFRLNNFVLHTISLKALME